MSFNSWLHDANPSIANLAKALRSSANGQRNSAARCGEWPADSMTGWAIQSRRDKARAIVLDEAAAKLEARTR